jgi:hypothetical protein
MQLATHTANNDQVGTESARLLNVLSCVTLLIVTTVLFGSLFNRETVLSYAIGYNLYGAERVLKGDLPYLDFHTLYPPATVYLNAFLFKLLGVTLYTALVGVMFFKVLTTFMLFLSARIVLPLSWAVAAASFSLIWLRPNGPFKAVPMHYGALFLTIGFWFLLKQLNNRSEINLIGAGVAIGLLTLFKHNIGVCALAGILATIVLDLEPARESLVKSIRANARQLFVVMAGFLAPIIPVLIYMWTVGALVEMFKTLLFGPGEFLVSRLSGLASPVIPILLVILLFLTGLITIRFRSTPGISLSALLVGFAVVIVFFLTASQALIDPVIFYMPPGAIIAGILLAFCGGLDRKHRTNLIALSALAIAAYSEAFPRFAREQIISAIPFASLLLLYVIYLFGSTVERMVGQRVSARLLIAILPILLFLMGGRLFYHTFFERGLTLKSNVELRTPRGAGVYFPPTTAAAIDEAVDYIQSRVPQDGYFFAHSYAASSLLFLSSRSNPSGAQFWGGVGVTEEDRRKTLEALVEKDVRLAVSSDKDLAAEKYSPLNHLFAREWRLSKRVDEIVILERP